MVSHRKLVPVLSIAAALLLPLACKDPGEEIQTKYDSARYSGSADAIIKEIEARGAEIVAFEITQNPSEWREILESVARGGDDWLDAALALNPGTSGNATDELTVAVRRALVQAPGRVLSRARAGYCIRCLCDVPDTRDARYATFLLAEAERVRRIAAVKTVEDGALSGARDACLAEFERGRDKLKRIFGR